ncbi:MAG: hypothetical protein MZV63_63525 [Marinilabiliales bacterium]|nr:hypothetical protein [Marinilabiliales bacterium]
MRIDRLPERLDEAFIPASAPFEIMTVLTPVDSAASRETEEEWERAELSKSSSSL